MRSHRAEGLDPHLFPSRAHGRTSVLATRNGARRMRLLEAMVILGGVGFATSILALLILIFP